MGYLRRDDYEAKHGPLSQENLDKKKIVACMENTMNDTVFRLHQDAVVRWYAVKVVPNTELFVRDFLINRKHPKRGMSDKDFRQGNFTYEVFDEKREEENVECYVPSSYESGRQKDRIVWHEKPKYRGVVFVHVACNRRQLVFDPYIRKAFKGFMCSKSNHKPQPIPDKQMEVFQKMLEGNMKVELTEEDKPLVGRHVRFRSGPLAGREAELTAVRKVFSKNEFQIDANGKVIFDIDGNPKPCEKLIIHLKLTDGLVAKTEILLSQVDFLD